MMKFDRSGAFDAMTGLLSSDILGAASRDVDSPSSFSKSLDMINDNPFILEFFVAPNVSEMSEFLSLLEIIGGNYVVPNPP